VLRTPGGGILNITGELKKLKGCATIGNISIKKYNISCITG
jgi:hypothetical protein